MFTVSEKESRYRAVRQILKADDLMALLLIGDTSVGDGYRGDLRYYTNNRVIFNQQVVVVFPDTEPVLFAWSQLAREAAARRSFAGDCRYSSNMLADIANLLKQHKIFKGRIGVNFEMLPTAWYMYLKQEFPQIEWVEMHEPLMQIRFHRSQEEATIFREGAALADGSFEAAVKFIRPGVSEYEIVAEIEHYARSRGAEEHFTLIGSGKFGPGNSTISPFIYSPTHRRIEVGDTVTMEITPRYEGYWTQLARTVSVGRRNDELHKILKICRDALKKGLEYLKPGKTVSDVVLATESYVAGTGYRINYPMGHICGVDLNEIRIYPQNKMVLEPGTAIIIHPSVFTPDGKSGSFWGETYLVTQDGYDRLNHAVDEVLVI
jgi:Xaa-Pro dipeptidase